MVLRVINTVIISLINRQKGRKRMKLKKMLTILLAFVIVFGSFAVSAIAINKNTLMSIDEEQVLKADSEEEIKVFSNASIKSSNQQAKTSSSGIGAFLEKIIDFFKTIFGHYKIDKESKLVKAASEGGTKWKLTKDITVSQQIVVKCSKELIIDGNNHTIKRENGELQEAVIKVSNNNVLNIGKVTISSSKGRCFTVNTNAKLIIGETGACKLGSYGDTIVNYGFTQLSGGTSAKSTGSGTASMWNMVTEKDERGEILLWKCNVDYILNEAKLTLKQDNSVVTRVTNTTGAKLIMDNGYIETLSYYSPLNKTQKGGIIVKTVQLDSPVPPVPQSTLVWPTNSNKITVLDRYSGGSLHGGIDIEKSGGTDVYAAADGTVAFAGYYDSYGNTIVIYHSGHTSRYAHLDSIGVKKGASVKAGQKIGVMGNTGESTGTHLHFEYYSGNSLYPGRELRSYTFDYIKSDTSICKDIRFTNNITPRSESRYNDWVKSHYKQSGGEWIWKG